MIDLTYSGVWKTLDTVDLTEYHQSIDTGRKDKNGKPVLFTYISWTDAWKVLMEFYPYAAYEFLPETYETNGTVMTHCNIHIGKLNRYMWLPVMNFKNTSVVNPTTREIQDARMRCLVKALSMFGLGAYLYRGEDLPSADKDAEEQIAKSVISSPDIKNKSVSYVFKDLENEVLVEETDPVRYLHGLGEILSAENPDTDSINLYEANKKEIAKAQKATVVKKYKDAYVRLVEVYEKS